MKKKPNKFDPNKPPSPTNQPPLPVDGQPPLEYQPISENDLAILMGPPLWIICRVVKSVEEGVCLDDTLTPHPDFPMGKLFVSKQAMLSGDSICFMLKEMLRPHSNYLRLVGKSFSSLDELDAQLIFFLKYNDTSFNIPWN